MSQPIPLGDLEPLAANHESLSAELLGYVELLKAVFNMCKSTAAAGVGDIHWGLASLLYVDYDHFLAAHPTAPAVNAILGPVYHLAPQPGAANLQIWNIEAAAHGPRFFRQAATGMTIRQKLIDAVPGRTWDAYNGGVGNFQDATIAELMEHLRAQLATVSWATYEEITFLLKEMFVNGHFGDFVARHNKIYATATTFGFEFTDIQKILTLQQCLIHAIGWLPFIKEFRRDFPSIASTTWANTTIIFKAYNVRRLAEINLAQAMNNNGALMQMNTMIQQPPQAVIHQINGLTFATPVVQAPIIGQAITPGGRLWLSYCHTHGPNMDLAHNSATCNRRGPNHRTDATLLNRLSGPDKPYSARIAAIAGKKSNK